ncbi:gfo/Idh/MocA family oxidoreductase [candidate division WS5 bacterium]|uniref:Gfo/Idh/MocA family oxidoreductase n=1 Tax=candidate division WS5 bacterium TaxID=2093353 RepID=A0A419DAS3_9BACT|nr:MAG: gfo/Idh/MocA family oxidoreductase [candidate division WS5 bacterium]
MYKIAVIGCGYWGPNLIRNFNALSESELTMVCDLDDNRLTYIKRLYPDVKAVKDDEEIYRNPEIDAIVIATPVRFHYEMASKSLLAGKHTFIEKPISNSVENGKKLIKLAKSRQKTLMVGHTFVYSPPVRRIKEIIDSGELGEIQYISSRRLNLGLFQNDINVAWDLAPHDISIILYTLGHDPISVNCQGKAHINPDIEDVTNMTLNFDNGCFATIQSSWLDPNKVREMTFVGSKKMLVYDDLEPIEKIKIYDKRVEVPPHYDTFAEFHYAYHYGDMYAPYIKQYEPMAAECQHFIDCIKTGAEPESGGQEALKVVQILEASSKSLKNKGGIVSINHIVD